MLEKYANRGFTCPRILYDIAYAQPRFSPGIRRLCSLVTAKSDVATRLRNRKQHRMSSCNLLNLLLQLDSGPDAGDLRCCLSLQPH